MAEAAVSAAATTTDVATSVARRLPNKPSAAPPKYVPNAHQLSARKKRKAAETLAKAARTAKAAGGAKLVAKTVGKKLLVPLDVALSLNAGRKLLSSGGRENARNMVEDMSKKSALDRITESQSDPLGTLYGTASGVNKLVTQTNATRKSESDFELSRAVAQRYQKEKESFASKYAPHTPEFIQHKRDMLARLRGEASRAQSSGNTANFIFAGGTEQVPRYSTGR